MRLDGSVLTSIGRQIAEIVLFSPCVSCGASLPLLSDHASICDTCWRDLPRITEATCDRCGLPWNGAAEESFTCLTCQVDPSELTWIRSWGHYKLGLQRALHAFKFERHDFLASPLSRLLTALIHKDETFDVIVPVPMHRTKLRRRGYNQAELLAKAMGRDLRIPARARLLKKPIERQTQSTLNRTDRVANVRSVFEASAKVAGLNVLLVDDIYTTGETIRACARELLRRKARSVCAVTVARA